MYDETIMETCRPLDFSIHEELGDVDYVFTDKTGTLTANILTFQGCSLDGTAYSVTKEDSKKDLKQKIAQEVEKAKNMNVDRTDLSFYQFFLSCSVCNDVLVIPGQDDFQGSSTDEITLVNAAKDLGFQLTNRTPNEVSIMVKNMGELKFKVLHKIEFTSERKKMTSVVQQEGSDEVLVYTKGADNVIIKAATTEKSLAKLNGLKSDLEEFSQVGFRTLCFGVKKLTQREFKDWKEKEHEAKMA